MNRMGGKWSFAILFRIQPDNRKEKTMSATQELPKSYLTEAKRQGLSQNGVYLAESQAADEAGDEAAAWQWLSYARLPAHSLMSLKKNLGADFIRTKGLKTDSADAQYGLGWLDTK
jgi:hypothetical protein